MNYISNLTLLFIAYIVLASLLIISCEPPKVNKQTVDTNQECKLKMIKGCEVLVCKKINTHVNLGWGYMSIGQ